jgi:hypothetical protein
MNDVEQRLRAALAEVVPDSDPVELGPIAHRVRRRRQGWTAAAAATGVLATVGVAALIAGPMGDDGPTVAGPTPSTSSAGERECPPTGPDADREQVDYVDFLRLGGREYSTASSFVHTLPARLIGTRVGTVRCTISQIKPGADYEPVDGDAAFLPRGTAIYAVRGYPVTARVAALVDGKYVAYQPTGVTAPAQNPFRLVRGKVAQIVIFDDEAGTQARGRITDTAKVNRVTTALATEFGHGGAVLPAKVSYVQFVLADGSATVAWPWDPVTANFAGSATLPADVNALLKAASG